jgi:hypothetical protein
MRRSDGKLKPGADLRNKDVTIRQIKNQEE